MPAVDMLDPGMGVAVGLEEEQPLRAHAAARFQQLSDETRPQVRQSLEYLVGMVETERCGNLVEQLDRRALLAGHAEEMVPRFLADWFEDRRAEPAGAEFEPPPFEPEESVGKERTGAHRKGASSGSFSSQVGAVRSGS